MLYVLFLYQYYPSTPIKKQACFCGSIDFKGLMSDYLSYVSESGLYKSRLIEIDNGLMISIKK